MSADQVKPPYNAKRRIQWLAGLSVFLIVATTAGWFYVAGYIDDEAGKAISAQQARNVDIVCNNREVRGYPFRFGIFCDALTIENAADGYVVDAGALRSAAQFYAPRDLVIELDGPLTYAKAGLEPFTFEWSQMRGRLFVSELVPQSASLVGQDFVVGREGFQTHFRAEQIEMHSRIVEADADLAGRASNFTFDDATPPLASLPPLDADFDIRFNDSAMQLVDGSFDLLGTQGELSRMALMLNDDSGILVSGPYSIADNGLLSATLEVRIVDVDAVMEVVARVFPDHADLLTAFANGQQRTGVNQDEVTLQINIVDGQARMGIIPLGNIPPF